MSKHLSKQALKAYLWGAATLLRGLVDAGDYKQFIFPLLFFKRLSDVWDEEYSEAFKETNDEGYARDTANERFIIPDGAHWEDVRAKSKDVGRAIQKAFKAIEEKNPDRLEGIFGDTPWTNKSRVPDKTLKDLLEHFSTQKLSLANVPEDEMGDAYEILVGQFADDSGHTAQEFYTNRTVVHLMTQMLDPQPGESIYDPTCGTGGMLISALTEVKRKGGEHRTLKLYGQERNHLTASIARMNLVLHGVDDFEVARGDTLVEPRFTDQDLLRTFDMVLANPPYSIKQWDREAWSTDPWGRNFLGTPPQGRADYAFFQHILKSLDKKTGRCAILFPHGVLFRKEEAEMRKKLVEADLVECVLGLGPNLFYNSPMEACIVICRTKKEKSRKGKVLFINAVHEVSRERSVSFLSAEQQDRIAKTFNGFIDIPNFSKVASPTVIADHDYSLSIPLYVKNENNEGIVTPKDFKAAWSEWQKYGVEFWEAMSGLEEMLDGVAGKGVGDV